MSAALKLVLRTLVSITMIVVAADALGSLVSVSAPDDHANAVTVEDPSFWPDVITHASAEGTVCRVLNLHIGGGKISGNYDLVLPRSHPIYQRVREGAAYREPQWFAHQVLGPLEFAEPPQLFAGLDERGWYRATFGPPAIQPPPAAGPCQAVSDGDSASIQVAFETFIPDIRHQFIQVRPALLMPLRDIVRIEGEQVMVEAGPQFHARILSENLVELQRTYQSDDDPELRFAVHLNGTKPAIPDAAGVGISVFSSLLWSLVTALPLLLVWRLVHRLETTLESSYLLFDHAMRGLVTLWIGTGVAFTLLDATLRWWKADLPANFLGMSSAARDVVGATALVLAGAAVCWPVIALARAHGTSLRLRPTSAGGASRFPRLSTCVCALGSGLVVIFAAYEIGQRLELLDSSLWMVAAMAEVAAVCYVGFLALLAPPVLSGRRLAWTAMGASVVTVLYAASDHVIYADTLTVIGVAVFGVAGSLLVLVLTVLAGRVFAAAETMSRGTSLVEPRYSFIDTLRLARMLATILVFSLGAALLVFFIVSPPPGWTLDEWGLAWVGEHVGELGYYVALIILIAVLADHRVAGDLDRSRLVTTREAGIVYVALTFYWVGEQIFFVPVSLLIGLIMTSTFMLTPGSQPDTFARRAEGLASRLARDRAVLEQLQPSPENASSAEEYQRYATSQRALDDELRLIGLTDAVTPPATARSGGWRHGVNAASIGALVGAPWIVLTLREMVTSRHEALFTAQELVRTTGWVILQWPLLGFFFGYFYPRIRGSSGLPKALALFLTAFVPPLAYLAIVGNRAYWSGYLTWGLQLLLFSLTLGIVAGDRWVLSSVGLRFRHVLDVHRKRYLLGLVTVVLVQAGLIAALVQGLLPILLGQLGMGVSASGR